MRQCENIIIPFLHFILKRLKERSAPLHKQMKTLGEHNREVRGWNADGGETLLD